MPGSDPRPRFHCVQGLADRGEAAPVDDALHRQQLLVGLLGIGVRDDDRGRQIAEGDVVGAELLQRLVRIRRLVVGIGIDQCGLAVEHHLAQDGCDRLALSEPLPPQARQISCCLGLVERDPAGRPAVGEAQVVERIEQSGHGRVRESEHRQHAQVLIPELRLHATEQRRIAEDGVDVGWDRRHGNGLAFAGDGVVQVGQGLGIAEDLCLG